jgi:hypothetical protein
MPRAVVDVWNEGGLERLDPPTDPDVVHHRPYDPRRVLACALEAGAEAVSSMQQGRRGSRDGHR